MKLLLCAAEAAAQSTERQKKMNSVRSHFLLFSTFAAGVVSTSIYVSVYCVYINRRDI